MRDSYPARPGHDILYEQLGLPRPEPGPGDGNKITPRDASSAVCRSSAARVCTAHRIN